MSFYMNRERAIINVRWHGWQFFVRSGLVMLPFVYFEWKGWR